MSTPAKTKPRDKKVVNDSHKTPPTKAASASGSIGGAYNPLLGTTVESSSLGRFRSIDESDSTGADCDSASNNGSWSGDSEDHKEKAAPPTPSTTKQETIPGADNEKREKMRLKNERKHQRQREKRAQELHERCCQFLMSRKLEVLTQKIVDMGIPHERATYALMLNQGKLEESINWLLDESGANLEDRKLDPPTFGNLKIDISEELGRILELETKYKCTKQDVERAVVTAEGDIERAEESLRKQKQDQSSSAASVKVEDVISDNNGKAPSVLLQPNSSGEEDRKNLGYSRGSGYISGESGNQSVNPMDQKYAAMEEKKRLLSQQAPLSRPVEETHNHVAALGDQVNRLQQQEIREPVTLMQQQQQLSLSANTNVLPVSTMNPSLTVAAAAAAAGIGSGWYPASSQSNGYLPTRTLPPSDLNSNLLMYHQLQYQQYQEQVSNGNRVAVGSAPHPVVAPAASLGLFSGYGSASSSGIDWNADGSMGKYDYNKIDWSLDRGLACPRQEEQQYVTAGGSPYEAEMNGRTRVNGMDMAMGVQEAALVGNGREWTSPFEGKDLFGLSRQYVPPSL